MPTSSSVRNADSGGKRRQLTDIIKSFITLTAIQLPDDVRASVSRLAARETQALAKETYAAMENNLRLALERKQPCCQDTGILQFFIKAGSSFPMLDCLEECIREASLAATKATPLRPNVVEFFEEKNTGTNTGTRIPWIDWEIVPQSDSLSLFLYLSGGGCSLPGFSKVFTPLEGYDAAFRAILDQLTSYGVNACPPLLVGIGFGPSADSAAMLSKKALLRFIGTRNSAAGELELRLENELNRIGIGPMGLTGNSSVSAVHIEQAGRHTASFAVGLSTGCWAHRRSLIKIGPDLDYTVLSHKGVRL